MQLKFVLTVNNMYSSSIDANISMEEVFLSAVRIKSYIFIISFIVHSLFIFQ